MSLTTVAELRSALGIGSLYSDSVLQEVCDAADSVLLPLLSANTAMVIAHENTATTGTLYFNSDITYKFLVGMTVTVSNCGAKHNGSKTITSATATTITYDISGNNNTPQSKHTIFPYGLVTDETTTDWTADAAIQEAALLISVDIYQSRQVSSTGGVSPDFSPSPYRMGNSLTGRVRGLIAHALDPRGLVG